jgi:hypothetical protein
MATSDFFRPDYSSAREAFLAAARSAGARLTSHLLPDHCGPAGEPLPWMQRPWAQQSPSRCCC